MQMNPYENNRAERAGRSDPELIARVQAIETVLPTLATRAQLEQLRGDMKEEIGAVRAEMKDGFGALRSELHKSIGDLRGEVQQAVISSIRWSIGLTISVAMLTTTLLSVVVPFFNTHLHG